MAITINGTSGITTPELTLDNTAADGGQVVLKSAGYSNWNLDNYSGSLRAYYNATEYMRMDSSGNFGIGTSSPQKKLSVANGAILAGNSGQVLVGRYDASFPGTATNGYFSLDTNNIDGTNGGLSIKTLTSDSLTEKMRIESDGSVRMYVNGNWKFRLTDSEIYLNFYDLPPANGTPTINAMSIGNSGWYVNCTGANNYWNHAYAGTAYNLRYRGSGVGSIVVNSSNVAYNTTSDYRLKENVQPMTGALAKVAQLKPVTYTWKSNGEDGEGFIAHELAEVCPHAVTGEKDAVEEDGSIKAQAIDTSFLVATLTAAIQEQQAIITDLKARVESLENK